MKQKKGLIILHIDGVSVKVLQKAIQHGHMAFTKSLLQTEGYTLQSYQPGLPSTTPYCQAGILYGDNINIPSFRWWDKSSGVEVKFGVGSTFRYVANNYFRHKKPLTLGGATLSACYPAGAKETFALSYKDRRFKRYAKNESRTLPLLLRWLRNPLHIVDWAWHSLLLIFKVLLEYFRAHLQRHPIALKYLFGDLLEELFAHHLTRYATGLALEHGLSPIYSCIYAYDETSHAFGPYDGFCMRMLGEVDRTIEYIAKRRTRKKNGKMDYELVILSDHGQIPTIPFVKVFKKKLAEIISDVLPAYVIDDTFTEAHKEKDTIEGHIKILPSGGLAHLYFTDISHRLLFRELHKKYSKMLQILSNNPYIAFIMVQDNKETVLLSDSKTYRFSKRLDAQTAKFLSQFGNPEIVARQLAKLNSFEKSGDIVLFGAFKNGKQINFEVQSGGHGSIGGDQMMPFIMTKSDWNIDVSGVTDASQLYSILSKLKKSL